MFVPLNLDLAKLDYETRAFPESRVPQDKTEERSQDKGKKGEKEGNKKDTINEHFNIENCYGSASFF